MKRTALKKSTTPINKIAPKRQKQLNEYYKLRDEFLKAHPACELNVDDKCGGAVCLHHGKGRENELLLDVKYWKAACDHCHDIVTEHSKEAIENGQSISRHKKKSE